MAKWIKDVVKGWKCSECGEYALWIEIGGPFARTFYPYKSDYCPHCGEPMRRMCEKCEYFSTCDRNKPFCGETE